MKPGLVITNVWTKVGPQLQDEIIEFWQSHQLLRPETDAKERAKQVVLTIRHEGRIVGLTSSGIVKFHQLNDNVFFLFRMIVLPEFRIPGIESKLIVETRDILEAHPDINKPVGMLTFVENPQLIAKRNEAVWPASKMVFIGTDKAGRHIRVYYFKGATI